MQIYTPIYHLEGPDLLNENIYRAMTVKKLPQHEAMLLSTLKNYIKQASVVNVKGQQETIS
jgi:hypothetical protein